MDRGFGADSGGTVFDASALPDRNETSPFDVIVVYPAVPGARAVSPATIDLLEPIRSYTSFDTVSMAADLDGDGGADAFISEFCCKTGESARSGCDEYVCW